MKKDISIGDKSGPAMEVKGVTSYGEIPHWNDYVKLILIGIEGKYPSGLRIVKGGAE